MAMAKQGELRHIEISKIRPHPDKMREVKKETEKYQHLVGSIKLHGILQPITVTKLENAEGQELYTVGDGHHRFEGAKDAGLDTIPCYIKDLNDAELEEAQILANIHRIETKPAEYAAQLNKILQRNPTLTKVELANRLQKSEQWLDQRLKLTDLDPAISKLVDEGKIGLTNAQALAKLPKEHHVEYLERAMTLSPTEFMPQISKHVKELKDALKQGREARVGFHPVAYLRKISELKDEMESPKVAHALCSGLQTPYDGFKAAIQWMMHMDQNSIDEQKAKYDKREQEKADEKAKREQERMEKKLAEAKEHREKAQAEMAAAGAA